MPRRAVFTEVMQVVERRIAEGDYMLKDLPGERKLAEEVGVSYMTARKAVLKLIDKQVLSRKSNGALVVHPRLRDQQVRPQVAFLTPAYPSTYFVHCRMAISRAAEFHHAQLKPVEYTHWFDPVVKEALQGSDGTLLIPSTEAIPDTVFKDLHDGDNKVVFFDADMTDHGIPSIRLFAREHINDLLNHLWALGHRKIDCLNAQGHNNEIDRRIDHWRDWLGQRGGAGAFYDTPAPPYEEVISRAHQTVVDLLDDDAMGTALVCTTQPAALGAIRACHDMGVQVGVDLSICTINNEPSGRYLSPSLTGLEMPEIAPLVEPCFEWFASEDTEWQQDLRIVPHAANLFAGESTGLVPASRR